MPRSAAENRVNEAVKSEGQGAKTGRREGGR